VKAEKSWLVNIGDMKVVLRQTLIIAPELQPGHAFEDTAFKPWFEIVRF
jgi:hypothetical protein